MRLLLVLLTFLFSLPVTAQLSIDKLRSSLKDAKGRELIDIQQKLAARVRHYDLGEADSLIRISIEKAQKLSYKGGEAMGLVILGGMIGNTGDFYEAERLVKKAISIAKKHQEQKVLTAAYINLGALYTQNDLDKLAIEQYILGAKIARKDTALIDYEITHLMNLGITHLVNENMNEARAYLIEAQEKSVPRENTFRTAQIYVNRAIVETDTKNFGIAIEYYLKGLKIFKEAKVGLAIGSTQIGLARCYIELGQLREGRKYLDAAKSHFSQAEENKNVQKNKFHLNYHYANYFYRLGILDSALISIGKSITLAEKLNAEDKLFKGYQLQAKIYESDGNFQLALESSKKAFIVRDSLHAKDKNTTILSLTREFDYQKLEQEKEIKVQLLDADIQLKNTYIIVLICGLLLLGFLFLWNRNRLKLNYLEGKGKMEAEQQKVIQEAKEHQLEKEYLIKHTHELIEKNASLIKNLEIIQRLQDKSIAEEEVDDLVQKIRTSLFDDKNWLTFNLYFEKLYPNFFQALKSDFDVKLTQYEQRLLALMKMELTNKEIGIILGIQRNSVVQAKTRLKDKLQFEDLTKMEDYIAKLS